MIKNQPSPFSFIVLVLISALLLISPSRLAAQAEEIPTEAETIAAGERLFKLNCQTCHKVQEQLIGPALANVYDRKDLDWIKSFIRNSQAVIASGDDYAVSLYDQYNQTVMTSFDFNDEELMSILAYVKDQTDNPPVEAGPAAGAEGAAGEGMVPVTYLYLILMGLLITLIMILIVLVLISGLLSRYLKQKGGLSEEEEGLVEERFDFGRLIRSKAFIGIVAFVFTAIALKTLIDEAYTIGVQQGYMPEQPIAFSHKIHAGQYEIDCNYCHTSVYKSASANIPSLNICMNCHNSIKEGAIAGFSEISKIYDAWENNQPVEWVRVHNLPDLAYFNHSQHVSVGGIECQTCHGPIEEMDVVYQYSLLTMGWCIDCHRKTELNVDGNDYYDKLVELHDSPDPMKVEDIGGLECAKCHY